MDTKKVLKAHAQDSIAYRKEVVDLKRRKVRADFGKIRAKYKSILPPKYKSYIARANSRGLPFDLSVEEFNHLLTLPCVYCGGWETITIDRTDSSDGYVKGNVRPCCFRCNLLKHSMLERSFLQKVKQIYEFMDLGNQGNY